MPPFYPEPPLDALAAAGASRWLDVALVVATVACEPWALALIALAIYSWLEREVPAVLKASAPLFAALAAGGGIALLAHASWTAPHLAGAGTVVGPFLHRVLPGAQTIALGAFAAYSLLAYGRRAAPPVLLLAVVGGAARIWAGPHWISDLAGGGAAGVLLGALAHLVALRLFPGGHLAQLRASRRGAGADADGGAEHPVP